MADQTSAGVDLQTIVIVWLAFAALILIRHTRTRQNVGLVLSYVLSLGALHWFATALYLLPWHDNSDRDLSVMGLRESLYAIGALWIGCEIGARLGPAAPLETASTSQVVPTRLVNVYITVGLAMYGLLFTSFAQIPSLTAVLSGGSTLMAAGIGLKCWNAYQTKDDATGRVWLATAFLFPVVTVLAQGFIGYGFAALTIVLAFRSSWQRLSLARLAFAAVVVFGGLSVYTTYMRDRDLIRDVVWTGGRVEDRLRQFTDTLSSFERFDFTNASHLARVNGRLNQNYLVGAAVSRIGDGLASFAKGTTIEEAVIALVPRAIWPNKTVSAGSGDLVSRYTGIRFAEGTSVGIGHLLECYVNFGRTGVVVGFVLLGMILASADRRAAFHLNRADSRRFLIWYLPTLNVLQVGGSFAEATAGAAAALVLVHGINWTGQHLWSPARNALASVTQQGAR